MADTTAEWSISLDTTCPRCKHRFDLLDEISCSSIQACETDTVSTRDYETGCPACGYEFTVDFVY